MWFMNSGCINTTVEYSDKEVIVNWAKMALYITKNTPSNTPTYASRCFGYIGLTNYESIVEGFPEYQSVASQLNGLGALPKSLKGKKYCWALCLNAAQAAIIRSLYRQTSDENKAKIDSLEMEINRYYSYTLNDEEVVNRSVSYGKSIAAQIFEWSLSDGGHRGYLKNFDKTKTYEEKPGSWKPPLYAQAISHRPLHPYWGENRTFLKINGEMPLPYMIPYDTIEGSAYYNEFLQVYKKDLELTQNEKEAAIWWGDDPDVTFTPPGHSYYLATQAIEAKWPSLIISSEVYAKVGLSVADAFINCWKWKYYFFSERPNTFIPKFIDPEWESFWPDPPFPCFPSGHAINGAASTTILESVFGTPFQIIDSAHIERHRDEIRDVDFKERSFDSFQEIAHEIANSRFYGGIHTPQDNQVGLEQGTIIANHVNALKWKKK
jgi:hypothetical protein